MIVECYGLPGAGKSTLVQELVKRQVCASVPKKVTRSLGAVFLVQHPFFTFRYLGVLIAESARTHTWQLVRFKLAVLLDTVSKIEYVRRHNTSKSVFLLDEGIAQRLLSLCETEKSPEWYTQLLRPFRKSLVVLHIVYKGHTAENVQVGSRRAMLGEAYGKKWKKTIFNNYTSITICLHQANVRECYYKRNVSRAEDEYQSLISCIEHCKQNVEL